MGEAKLSRDVLQLRQLYEHSAVQSGILSMGRDQDNLPLLNRQIGMRPKARSGKVSTNFMAITKQVY